MFDDLKREAFEANLALVKHGLVALTFGNASTLDQARGIYAIKPSGVPYADLKHSDMVLVDLDGRQVEGCLRPSSDSPTHRRLYLAFPEIGGIVHTHSLYATAFAQAGREIPMVGTTHADYFAGNVPVTRKLIAAEINGGAYEWETGNIIAELFMQRGIDAFDYPAVLVNRHALFTWGKTGASAVEAAVATEYIAHLAFLTSLLVPDLEGIEIELREQHFKRKHGPGAYYGQILAKG